MNIKKFDLNILKNGGIIAVIGRKLSGKTTLVINDLLPLFKDRTNIIISPTANIEKLYQEGEFDQLYDQFDTNLLKQKIDDQIENKDTNRALIFLDEVDGKIMAKDQNIRNIFLNGRHFNMDLIVSQQSSSNLPPVYRANMDYVFLFGNKNLDYQKKLYQDYGGMFSSFEIFAQVFERCTKKYGCMVINQVTSDVFCYQSI